MLLVLFEHVVRGTRFPRSKVKSRVAKANVLLIGCSSERTGICEGNTIISCFALFCFVFLSFGGMHVERGAKENLFDIFQRVRRKDLESGKKKHPCVRGTLRRMQ